MANQNSILIKNETEVLQINWTCDIKEDSNEDEGEADMYHAKEKSVLDLKEAELTTRISQGVEGELLNVVKKEEEIYVGIDEQHSDGVFEKAQLENELLKCLLKAPEYEKGIAGIDRRMFQVLVETKAYTSLLNYGMFASIQRSASKTMLLQSGNWKTIYFLKVNYNIMRSNCIL